MIVSKDSRTSTRSDEANLGRGNMDNWRPACIVPEHPRGDWYENKPRQTRCRGNPCGCPPPLRIHFHPTVCRPSGCMGDSSENSDRATGIRRGGFQTRPSAPTQPPHRHSCEGRNPALAPRDRSSEVFATPLYRVPRNNSVHPEQPYAPRTVQCRPSVTGDGATRKYVRPEPVEGPKGHPQSLPRRGRDTERGVPAVTSNVNRDTLFPALLSAFSSPLRSLRSLR